MLPVFPAGLHKTFVVLAKGLALAVPDACADIAYNSTRPGKLIGIDGWENTRVAPARDINETNAGRFNGLKQTQLVLLGPAKKRTIKICKKKFQEYFYKYKWFKTRQVRPVKAWFNPLLVSQPLR